jgi:hypothetical protein
MENQQQDRFVAWLAEWLAVRMESRPASAVTANEVTWPELQAMLAPDELGLFFTLVSLADGRKSLEFHPDQLLSFLSMSAARFDQVTKRLVELGLVETWPAPRESVEWRIIRAPASP